MIFEAWCGPRAASVALPSLGLPVVDLPYVPWAASAVALPAATAWGLSGTRRGAAVRLREPGLCAAALPQRLCLCEALSRADRWRAFGGRLLPREASLSTGVSEVLLPSISTYCFTWSQRGLYFARYTVIYCSCVVYTIP